MAYNKDSSSRDSAPRDRDSAPRDRDSGDAKKSFFRRSKACPFSGDDAPKIDWKDTRTLGRYISDGGKMLPSRITNVSLKKQRKLAQAIKRARFMALLPYVAREED
jgi:small subunit ribosomal protein S18